MKKGRCLPTPPSWLATKRDPSKKCSPEHKRLTLTPDLVATCPIRQGCTELSAGSTSPCSPFGTGPSRDSSGVTGRERHLTRASIESVTHRRGNCRELVDPLHRITSEDSCFGEQAAEPCGREFKGDLCRCLIQAQTHGCIGTGQVACPMLRSSTDWGCSQHHTRNCTKPFQFHTISLVQRCHHPCRKSCDANKISRPSHDKLLAKILEQFVCLILSKRSPLFEIVARCAHINLPMHDA